MKYIIMIFVTFLSTVVLATDYCSRMVENKDHKMKGLRACKDGSTSFDQPASTGYRDYEGKCGQTAAANLTYFYCKLALSPKADINDFFSDITPGVLPRTLKNGLNDIFSYSPLCPSTGDWNRLIYSSGENFINGIISGLKTNVAHKYKLRRWRQDGNLVFTTPVAALIAVDSVMLHWITIVDLIRTKESCTVVYNDIGIQREMTCDKLKYESFRAGLIWSPAIFSYTLIKYKLHTER